jgi:O-antigen ligase
MAVIQGGGRDGVETPAHVRPDDDVVPHPSTDPGSVPPWLAPLGVSLLVATVGAWLIGFAGVSTATVVVAGALGGALLVVAGWRIWPLVLIVIAARPSLDWFTAGRSDGGSTPVTGLQPAVAVGAVILVVGGAWLITQWASRSLVRPSLVTVVFGVYVAALLATSVTGDHLVTNVQTSLRATAGWVLVAVIEQLLVRDPGKIRALLVAAGVSFVIPAAVSIGDLMSRTDERNWTQSTFVNRNTYAVYLTVLALVLISARKFVHGWARFGASIGTATASGFLVFTYCRAAWAGLAVGLVILAMLGQRWLLWLVAGSFVAVSLFVPSVSDRLSDLDNERVADMGDPNSWEFRNRYWRELIATYIDGEPIDQTLAGVGLGTVEVENPTGLEPHNVWVQAIVETGAIGTAALVVFLGGTTVAAVRVTRRRWTTGQAADLHRACAAATLAIGANWLTQSISQNLVTEAVMWTVIAVPLGATAAADHLPRRRHLRPQGRETLAGDASRQVPSDVLVRDSISPASRP